MGGSSDAEPERARPDVALFMGSLGGGGAERAMLDIARGLSQRELAVDLVLLKAEGPYLELVPEDVRLIDLDSRRARTALPNLRRYLRRERPGVLVSTLSVVNVVAILAKLLFARDMPLVVRRAALFSIQLSQGDFKNRMIVRLERLLLPFANVVLTNSFRASDDLRRGAPRAAHKVRTIHNPVVWPDTVKKAAAPVEHPWFGKSEPPVILAAGRFAREKDHPTLLMAFAEVAKTRPARLVVLGEGQERSNLENLARELGIAHVVDFPGFKLNPFAYMSKASVFAHSSTHEGSPNVLIQAMACGTPVVSTDCPFGPGEILEDGRWGRLVPVGDYQALAQAITDTLDSPMEPARLITRANDFSAESSIDRYMEVISECLPGATR